MDLKNNLICEYCNRQFEWPVILPCGETICKRDLKDLYKEDEKNIIMCYFCGEEHHVEKRDGFPKNKLIIKLIEEASMETDAFSVKRFHRAKKLCTLLKHKVEHLETIQKNPSYYLETFFNQLIREIDNKKDYCKLLIDTIYENMVKEVDLFRFECLCQSKVETDLSKLNFKTDLSDTELVAMKVNDWHLVLDSTGDSLTNTLDDNRLRAIEVDAENLIKKIEKRTKEIKELLFLNVNCKFEPKDLNLDSNIFGKIVIVSESMRLDFKFSFNFINLVLDS